MKENSLQTAIHRARYESFGGIVSCIDPPFIAWVDRNFMREIGYENSPLWQEQSGVENFLSAPTEVHFSVTNRCNQTCAGCYMNSHQQTTGDLSTDALKKALKELADMGVFHVALGGGEAFERNDFAEIVRFCRTIGLVPNLTTNGQNIGKAEIKICKKMGQVNLSIDGIGSRYSLNGRSGDFKKTDDACKALKKAGVCVGINCVVSNKNYRYLEEVIRYAAEHRLNEVEFLKYKPAGRGNTRYHEYALTQEMIREFYPRLIAWSNKFPVELKVDCSFIPALMYHKPPKEDCEKLAVSGCDGGNMLLSVKSNGMVAGCSFVLNNEPVSAIRELWSRSKHLSGFRDLVARAEQPCKACDYLSVCRCGCRAVALHYTNDFFAPDPECPLVYDYQRNHTIPQPEDTKERFSYETK